MSTTVHTADGREGRIIESETVRGKTRHRVAGISFDKWYPETQVHLASEEDGWMPIPQDREQADPYSDPGLPPEGDVGPELGGDLPPDDSMGDILQGLSEYAATGELSPEDQAQYAGSPDPETILGFRTAGPGDHVDESNSVALPWNPDPQHDAVVPAAEASWGPGEYTIDADERLHPADSLSFHDVEHSEAGPTPGPAPHLFAAYEVESRRQAGLGDAWDAAGSALGDVYNAGTVPSTDSPMKDLGTAAGQVGDAIGSGVSNTWNALTSPDVTQGKAVPEPAPPTTNINASFADWARSLDDETPSDEYAALDSHDWLRAHGDEGERLVSRDEIPEILREQQYQDDAAAGLDRAAARLGDKYVDIGYGIITADHFHDPVQMFRDDPHGFIARRGGATAVSAADAEMDRYGALVEHDQVIRLAAWRDITAKAKRLRAEGKITVNDISPDRIYATVQGDNGVYETLITKGSSLGGYDAYGARGDQHVGNWHCSCKWGDWAFKRRFTFIGRLCSHGLASYWEMQAAHQAQAAGESGYRDPRRTRVRTKRGYVDHFPEDRPLHRDRGLGPLIDHYGPHDDFDPEQVFADRTRDAQDYARRSDLPGDADDVPLGLHANLRAADLLRMTPRSMTPDLNFIDAPDHSTETVDVTGLKELDMKGASDQGELPADAASEKDREAARHLGRRMVALLAEQILPDFEEWYAKNNGRQLDQARPTEVASAVVDYARERGLDQATSEMLQEFVAQNFSAEDTQPGADAEPEIKHFEIAAGRYLMAAMRTAVDSSGGFSDFSHRNDDGSVSQRSGDTFSQSATPGQRDNPANTEADNQDDPSYAPGSMFRNPGGVSGQTSVFDGVGSGKPGLTTVQPGGTGGAPQALPHGPAGTDNGPHGSPTGGPVQPTGIGNAAPGGGGSGGSAAPVPGSGKAMSWGGPNATAPAAGSGGWGPSGSGGKGGDYTVQSGDNLTDIAKSQGVSLDSLEKGNAGAMSSGTNIGVNPDLIHPGDKLTLPGGGSAASGLGNSAGGGGSGGSAAASPGWGMKVPSGGASPSAGWGMASGSGGGGTPAATPTATPSSTPPGGGGFSSPGNTNPALSTPSTPTVSPLDAFAPTKPPTAPATKSSRRRHYVLASDDALLNHLRELSSGAVSPEHTDDVRHTIDELRERGADASFLVATVRQATGGAAGPNIGAPAAPTGAPAAPALGNQGDPLPAGMPQSGTGAMPGDAGYGIAASLRQADDSGAGAAAAMGTAGPGFPTTVIPVGGYSSEDSATMPPPMLPTARHHRADSDFGTTPPRPQGPSTASETGGTGEALPGGSGGAVQQDTIPGASGPTTSFSGGGSGGGGLGGDFMSTMQQVMPMISGVASGIGGLLGGGGLGSLASGLGGILGALPKNDEDDHPLLGEQAITVGDVPTSFAGTGPDHQHWMSSSEDYVKAHEERHRHDIDDFEGDILKYSGSFGAALRQANAFDNYADWGFAETDSADPSDWGSVEQFLSDAQDRQGYLGVTEPAKTDIKEHLHYTQASSEFARHLAAANAGYFGVGAAPGLPTTDGLSHSNGAANLKGVIKPKKVRPPKAPKLPAAIPSVQPQAQQMAAPQFSAPPPETGGPTALAQPRTSALARPGQVAPLVTSERPGGIQRQAAQVGAGHLAPVFAEMGFSPPPEPQYAAYEPAAPVAVVDYNPYRQAAAGPTHTSPWDDVSYLPGQDPVGQAPPPVNRHHAGMSMQAQHVAHDPTAASLMGEYRDPTPGSYQRTNDASDVVRQFQASMGGDSWASDYTPTGAGGFDVSAGANQFLQRTAGRVFSQADQLRLEQESHVLGARNLDELDLRNTHYMDGV